MAEYRTVIRFIHDNNTICKHKPNDPGCRGRYGFQLRCSCGFRRTAKTRPPLAKLRDTHESEHLQKAPPENP